MPESKAAQIAEAEARQAGGLGVDSTLTPEAIEGEPQDSPRGDEGGQPQRQAAEPEPKAPPPRAEHPNITKRNEIIARFRQDRTETAEAERDDVSDFARSGMPPEFEPQIEPEPEPPVSSPDSPPDSPPDSTVETQPESRPQKVKVKIRGVEKEITMDEVIAEAQKSLAGESYLEEGRSKLKEIDDELRNVRAQRNSAPRESQPPAPGGQPNTQTGDQPTDDGQPQPDPIAKLIETLQFGDPNEARELLQTTIATATQQIVNQELVRQRLKDEGARSNKVLQDFVAEHADLANDPMSEAAIQRQLYDLQVEDLKAINVDLTRIPTPSGQLTPADIAVAHRYYRSEGYNVRSPKEMLETAVTKFLAWKGVDNKTPTPAGDPTKAAPRVEVTVDRTARRAAIPQQPSRPATPARAPTQPAAPAARRDGSEIVQAMMAKRGLPRGRVLG